MTALSTPQDHIGRSSHAQGLDNYRQALNCLNMAQQRLVEPFRLLDLPSEIRLLIYEFAVTHDEDILMGWDGSAESAVGPALCRSCTFVKGESLPVYYEVNTFVLGVMYQQSRKRGVRWIDLSAPYLHFVKKLDVIGCYYVNRPRSIERVPYRASTHTGTKTRRASTSVRLWLEEHGTNYDLAAVKIAELEKALQDIVQQTVVNNEGELVWRVESVMQLVKDLVFVGTGL